MRKIPKIDFNPFAGFYLDIDGVFGDFDRRVYEISGRYPHQFDKGMWKFIMADKHFFAKLEMMPDADVLWEYVKQYDPEFLTGAPPGERFQEQKRVWVAKNFGPQYKTTVLPRKDKPLHSGPNKVLIDDHPENVALWAQKGGHGVHFKGDVHATIELIEELRLAYKVRTGNVW